MNDGREQPSDRREPGQGRQRIDKWLFFARLRKSRSLAAKSVEQGDVSVNGQSVRQPSFNVKVGDTIILSLDRRDMVVKVLLPGARRGPYEEARTLYEDLTPPPLPRDERNLFEQVARERGAGRPTKRERRETDALRGRFEPPDD
ncbi:RNA-binding S4 domain-containing protein [Mycoplana rhizolycopersici]|uniref:RNA-binding S4 domain-containing protein n=1 Tax=Mycoplana rhizolycopersici TaxID=2746702 RepID=A0ABX2Q7X8_9HYPH|nr:RNA-binding S4 domain-containing protein [Rhizobium rhizolycopersici]NVP53798.1 RNA-binding S4 domain-containing protein [Rhizobium rhizolycopersici]